MSTAAILSRCVILCVCSPKASETLGAHVLSRVIGPMAVVDAFWAGLAWARVPARASTCEATLFRALFSGVACVVQMRGAAMRCNGSWGHVAPRAGRTWEGGALRPCGFWRRMVCGFLQNLQHLTVGASAVPKHANLLLQHACLLVVCIWQRPPVPSLPDSQSSAF